MLLRKKTERKHIVSNYFSSSAVLKIAVADDQKSVWFICEQLEKKNIKPWLFAKIAVEYCLSVYTRYTSKGTFFAENWAEKQFYLKQGQEWTGKDSIDA